MWINATPRNKFSEGSLSAQRITRANTKEVRGANGKCAFCRNKRVRGSSHKGGRSLALPWVIRLGRPRRFGGRGQQLRPKRSARSLVSQGPILFPLARRKRQRDRERWASCLGLASPLLAIAHFHPRDPPPPGARSTPTAAPSRRCRPPREKDAVRLRDLVFIGKTFQRSLLAVTGGGREKREGGWPTFKAWR